MNKAAKFSCASSVFQILLILVASILGFYARSKHLDPVITDNYQTILVLISLGFFVINVPIVIYEGMREFKKKHFNKLVFGLALLNIVILVLIVVFPDLIPKASCGCAPPGGI
jgi:cytochrome bd-type quinol oxidase subunit 2